MTHRAINIDQFSSERIFEIDQVIWNAWWLDPMAGPAGRQHAARRGIGRVQAQWFIFADILRDLVYRTHSRGRRNCPAFRLRCFRKACSGAQDGSNGCRAHQCITSRQQGELPLLLYPYAGLHPKHAAFIPSSQGCTTQSRQPTNQVITFPQISAIWASTNRPIRTLRQFSFRPARPRASPSK